MSTTGRLLRGAENFRAVRPYRTADGRHLRADTLFRSGELSRLSEVDLQTVAGLGIRLICDLRSSQERSEFSSLWPDDTGHRLLELPDRDNVDGAPHKIFESMLKYPGAVGAAQVMERMYRAKPRRFAANLEILFREIQQGGALPLLVHCHAGKDRTGFVIAMLLAAIGVPRGEIIEDYVATARFFAVESESRNIVAWAKRSFGHDLDAAAAIPLTDARAEYIEASFAEIDAGWGGIDLYLQSAVGLSDGDRGKLQAMLLR